MTSDYKVCINCVVGGMKIQNMIPIQVYINVHMHQHSIDTGFNTILHDQRSITSEGVQDIHLKLKILWFTQNNSSLVSDAHKEICRRVSLVVEFDCCGKTLMLRFLR